MESQRLWGREREIDCGRESERRKGGKIVHIKVKGKVFPFLLSLHPSRLSLLFRDPLTAHRHGNTETIDPNPPLLPHHPPLPDKDAFDTHKHAHCRHADTAGNL
ncbi:unnamed protein product [Gadus morhua 'NCC']